MTRIGYASLFALAVVGLTIGGISAFNRIDALARAEREASSLANWPQEIVPVQKQFAPIAASAADYAKYEAEDAEWRKRFARQYTIAELRVRGDGRRSDRQKLQDRVYELRRRGQNQQAINELERWVTQHPRDEDALLWLARMLNESGRSEEAVARYRQILGNEDGTSR